MVVASVTPNETIRLEALRDYAILDSAPEGSYDDIARLAAHICTTPIALVSLIDRDRQWFKARIGIDVCESSRDLAFCAHAIHDRDLLVVPDATLDPRFASNPLVVGEPFIRFYAGAPLITPKGLALGTLCVIDRVARDLNTEQRSAMEALARQVVGLLELRRTVRINRILFERAQKISRRFSHQANHDPLTQLANRALFSRKVEECVRAARTQRHKTVSALLFLDLDRFKSINDTLGHGVGDELLRLVAQRLRNCVRQGPRILPRSKRDIVGRLGGDEFTILLRDMESAESALLVADRVVKSLAEPYLIAGQPVSTSASVGVVPLCGTHETADDAMRDADTAMYEAKRHGRRCVIHFDHSMRSAAQRRLQLEHDLRRVFTPGGNATGAFHLHYQPIVSLESGLTVGFEALARWNHAGFGPVSPAEFIPIAEESGLISLLGDWAIDRACGQLRDWTQIDGHFARLSMNVNVSRRQLLSTHLASHVKQVLDATALAPTRLHLEITESAVMSDGISTIEVLRQLRELGVGLLMDDFGTGHSSLSCLHRFPLTGLKIDRSFIATASEQRDYTAVVYAVMNLARNLKMTVVAEGVEHFDQVQMLRSLDCKLAQGYHFGYPLDPEAVLSHIRLQNPPVPMHIAA